jgi:hypothetical protein
MKILSGAIANVTLAEIRFASIRSAQSSHRFPVPHCDCGDASVELGMFVVTGFVGIATVPLNVGSIQWTAHVEGIV